MIREPESLAGVLAGIGAVVGMGQLLLSDEPITFRRAVGRAIVSGGLGCSGALIAAVFPSADPVVIFGSAAALASLGASGLELVVRGITRQPAGTQAGPQEERAEG